jgi:hypothetical protein
VGDALSPTATPNPRTRTRPRGDRTHKQERTGSSPKFDEPVARPRRVPNDVGGDQEFSVNFRTRHAVAALLLVFSAVVILSIVTLYLAAVHPGSQDPISGARVGRFTAVTIFSATGRDEFHARVSKSNSVLSGDALTDLRIPLASRLGNLQLHPGDDVVVNSIGFPFRCALMVRIYNSGNLIEQHGRFDVRIWLFYFIIPSDPHFGWLFANFMSILISCSAFVLVLWLVVDRAIKTSRLRRGACQWCGYAGVPKFHKCPECGR